MVELKGQMHLGEYEDAVSKALIRMGSDAIIARIWAEDYTVWAAQPDQITNRLGWLNVANELLGDLDRLNGLREAVLADGYERVVWLGMGGSSLAPDVYSRVFGAGGGGLPLDVLDSTDPDAVQALTASVDLSKTLFAVATKSGTTAETLSFFKHFYNQTLDAVGADEVGEHFIAVTDGGSHLDKLAQQLNFREIFRNNPQIGGRYSALSHFGMVAAALLDVNVEKYLTRAVEAADACHLPDNPAARLGTVMGVLANKGRDKLTLILSPSIEPFGDWVEQLIAESTGKSGTGILPVVGEELGAPGVYGDDRLFVYLKLSGEDKHDAAIRALIDEGKPVVEYELADLYDLGAQMFIWELATAVAGYHLGIHPFNQPNVESAKTRAREMMEAYRSKGKLPALDAALEDGDITVYGDVEAGSAPDALRAFVAQGEAGSYIALQAYVEPTDETTTALRDLQTRLRDATGYAVTVGYGPRFLHSTGQLHKGDGGRGLFIQFTADDERDVPIPDEAGAEQSSISFGVLKAAQALGDRQALLDAGRRVLRFDLGSDVVGGLQELAGALA